MAKKEEIEYAIAELESKRGILDDKVVDIAIESLKKQITNLFLTQESETPLKQQRKLITVLFMDIVNSTELFLNVDPEENLFIMDSVLQRLSKPVLYHGGRVTRFMGDGFLSIFGLPVAKENDPENAVKSGLEILKEAENIALQLEKDFSLKGFQVRVGINTGLVVAGGTTEAEDTIMGSAVNLAARLESSASPGSLLISEYTYQHIIGLFKVEKGNKIKMKGFLEPIQVYSVSNINKTGFHLMNRGVEGIETKLIGHEEELLILKDRFNSVKQSGKSQYITIVGEAGLGKSRMLYEIENWIEDQTEEISLFRGRTTQEMQAIPNFIFRNLIATSFGILEDDSIAIIKRKMQLGFQNVLETEKQQEIDPILVGYLLGYNFRESFYIQNLLANPKQLHDLALLALINFSSIMHQKN